MEIESTVEKKWLTLLKKDELISQWKQSEMIRNIFCHEQGLNYNSFITWNKEQVAKLKTEAGFSEVNVQIGEKTYSP